MYSLLLFTYIFRESGLLKAAGISLPMSMADLNLSFLNESKNTDLIRWSDNGNSFIVLDEDEFAKILILELFKHNNYASFVRNKSGKGNVRVKTEDADDHEHDDYDDATGALRDERARNRELSLVQSVR
ncbi:hypothetical protein KXW28_003969 [Aspergillus fumigatus]|nr:hypothetical protein CNMCM8714_007187 [Aspergillus fumigatus]KAH1334276.1 hypothetical protein KXX67_006725 [Aspergillus fumigatus]KAH1674135.1 hypothetical protein KXX65_005562 [Aspergillus fumigatus]KAH1864405.1 hypothetical protein KXX01_002084 [Aspergillus fumigatus]KAH1968364.1 hypothetical protein KXV80_002040 [Aspergillus fumigatus]